MTIAINDNAESGVQEDQVFDNFEDAVGALSDDEATEDNTETNDLEEESSDSEESQEEQPDDSDLETEEGSEAELVILDGGEEVSIDELKNSYFRHKDYTHKTEALSKDRKSLDSERESYTKHSESLQSAYNQLTSLMEGLVPPEPDVNILYSENPERYHQELALRNEAINLLKQVYDNSNQAKTTIQQASDDDISRYKASETEKLLSAMPYLKEPALKAEFDANNLKTAQEFGFTEHEVKVTSDNRVLQLVHYARIGKIAEQNRKNAQRRRAEKPSNGKPAKPAKAPSKNHAAMQNLKQTGSIEAGMAIDFY